MYNLRNRSFLKEIDFSRDELLHLLALSAGAEDRQVRRQRGAAPDGQGDRADLREDVDPHALRVRGRRLRPGRPRHLPRPDAARRWATRSRSPTPRRVLGRMYDAIEYRGSGQENVEELAAHAGVPVYNGLTDEWHPTQMLADFLTMHERSHKPYDEIAYAFVGDGALQHGPLAARHRRDHGLRRAHLVAPGASCGRRTTSMAIGARRWRQRPARGSRSPTTSPRGVAGADFVHTDVWVSMGEPKDVWTERAQLLRPYQVNAELLAATGNPQGQVHALPAGIPRRHDRRRRRDRRGDRHDGRARGHRRRLPVAGEHRLRPGREPTAHDQGVLVATLA